MTDSDRQLAHWLAVKGNGILRNVKLAMRPLISRRRAKAGKVVARKMRQEYSRSMLAPHNTHPRPFKPLQGQLDSRSARLLSKWYRNKKG